MRPLLIYIMFVCPTVAWAQDPPAEQSAAPARSSRMEFDERLVKGAVASGSVYLFHRKARELPALVPVRRSYRADIVEPLLGNRHGSVEAAKPISALAGPSGRSDTP